MKHLLDATSPRNRRAAKLVEGILAGDQRFVSVFASYPALWDRFVGALQEKELSDNPLFKTRDQRTKNVKELRAVLRRIFAKYPAKHWVKLLSEAGVPGSLVNTIGEALDNPQVVALDLVQEQEHPTAGTIRVLGVPVTLSETPGRLRTPAPLLGEHTAEVLTSPWYRDDIRTPRVFARHSELEDHDGLFQKLQSRLPREIMEQRK